MGPHMMMAKLAIFVCFGMMLTFVVEADLDVHCLHKHVRGTWTFHMTEANMDKNGIKCSKGVTQAYGSKSNNYGLGEPNYKPVKTIEVELGKKNVASATIGGKHHKGTWTMIYDEGFEVNINDQTFFAFSKYKTKGSETLSYCGKTFPGWYHPVKDVDAKNDLVMTGKVSQGHKFLTMNNVQTKEVKQPKMDTAAKAEKVADAIFDPAFTRAQRATPALEEVQTFTEDQVGEREEADGVVEESNGAVWPEA